MRLPQYTLSPELGALPAGPGDLSMSRHTPAFNDEHNVFRGTLAVPFQNF